MIEKMETSSQEVDSNRTSIVRSPAISVVQTSTVGCSFLGYQSIATTMSPCRQSTHSCFTSESLLLLVGSAFKGTLYSWAQAGLPPSGGLHE